MITCVIEYQIDPLKLASFEEYGKQWIELVEGFGGTHHGYYLPHEGATDKALALFSFPSLAAYEQYRSDSMKDDTCLNLFRYADDNQLVIRSERSFYKPLST